MIGDEISLCDIVEGLKHFLTNTSPTERAFGVQLLVDVLQNLSTTKVNDKELTYLSAFFVDRLKDHHSVVPHVIVGIIALVSFSYGCFLNTVMKLVCFKYLIYVFL